MTEVNSKKQSLGKGLSALLGPDLSELPDKPAEGVKLEIEMMYINPGRYQPRRVFEEEDIRELADSMKYLGILQPILVRRHNHQTYEIIAGERRWRAAKLAGFKTIPVIIKNFNDREMFEAALIENMQRKELSAIEEAQGMAEFLKEFGYTQEQLSQKTGKSRSYVANMLRLTTLPLNVKLAVLERKITASHARALLNTVDPEAIMEQVLNQKMNVRATEKLAKVHSPKSPSKPRASPQQKDNDLLSIEHKLSGIFNTKVGVDVSGHKGRISIYFTSLQMLDEVIHKIEQIPYTDQVDL